MKRLIVTGALLLMLGIYRNLGYLEVAASPVTEQNTDQVQTLTVENESRKPESFAVSLEPASRITDAVISRRFEMMVSLKKPDQAFTAHETTVQASPAAERKESVKENLTKFMSYRRFQHAVSHNESTSVVLDPNHSPGQVLDHNNFPRSLSAEKNRQDEKYRKWFKK